MLHTFDQTLTLILKYIRNIENSAIRKSQILNFYSEDSRKKWFLLKISEYFSGNNPRKLVQKVPKFLIESEVLQG